MPPLHTPIGGRDAGVVCRVLRATRSPYSIPARAQATAPYAATGHRISAAETAAAAPPPALVSVCTAPIQSAKHMDRDFLFVYGTLRSDIGHPMAEFLARRAR